MKKSIFLLTAIMLLPLLACTPEGAEKEEFASTQLIINSFLDVSESRHIVRLSCEIGGRTVAAEGAELYCTVGEGSPVRAEEALLEGAGAYCFCADLVRGERVRIEAVYNGLRASACVKVPDHACLLSLVDVREKDGLLIADCSISKAYNGSPYCRLRMRLRYPDGSCSEELCQYHKDNELLDRRLGNDASDKFFESGACSNHYCIFASSYIMSSTTVQTQIKLDELPDEWDDAYALEVSLLSFDNELYDYYSVLNLIYDAYSGFALPSNVSGGKGFVGIFIPSTIVLEP